MDNKPINVGIRLIEKNDAEAIDLLSSVENKSKFIRNLLNGLNKPDIKEWVQNQEDLSASLRQAIKFFTYQFGTDNANDAIMKKSLGQTPTITVQEKIEETDSPEENDESLDEEVINGVDELDITEKNEEPDQEESDDDTVPDLDLSMLNRKM